MRMPPLTPRPASWAYASPVSYVGDEHVAHSGGGGSGRAAFASSQVQQLLDQEEKGPPLGGSPTSTFAGGGGGGGGAAVSPLAPYSPRSGWSTPQFSSDSLPKPHRQHHRGGGGMETPGSLMERYYLEGTSSSSGAWDLQDEDFSSTPSWWANSQAGCCIRDAECVMLFVFFSFDVFVF